MTALWWGSGSHSLIAVWGCCVLLMSLHVSSSFHPLPPTLLSDNTHIHRKPLKFVSQLLRNFHLVPCVDKSHFNFCRAQNDASQNKFGQCHFITVTEDVTVWKSSVITSLFHNSLLAFNKKSHFTLLISHLINTASQVIWPTLPTAVERVV